MRGYVRKKSGTDMPSRKLGREVRADLSPARKDDKNSRKYEDEDDPNR